MFAYTPESQEGIISIHSAKQLFAGRSPSYGSCYIPTLKEWISYLSLAGFIDVNVVYVGTSNTYLDTWRGQFGKDINEDDILYKLREIAIDTAKKTEFLQKNVNLN